MARITSALLIVYLFASGTPSLAAVSDPAERSPAPAATAGDGPLRLSLPAAFDAAAQSQLPQRQAHHCCNLKGTIIGSAIGAGAGAWLTQHTCDAGDCTLDYVKTMAALGGIGAVVGAFADRHHAIPIASPDRRLRVGGMVTATTRQAFATLAF